MIGRQVNAKLLLDGADDDVTLIANVVETLMIVWRG
jgi:hypothetical protein